MKKLLNLSMIAYIVLSSAQSQCSNHLKTIGKLATGTTLFLGGTAYGIITTAETITNKKHCDTIDFSLKKAAEQLNNGQPAQVIGIFSNPNFSKENTLRKCTVECVKKHGLLIEVISQQVKINLSINGIAIYTPDQTQKSSEQESYKI